MLEFVYNTAAVPVKSKSPAKIASNRFPSTLSRAQIATVFHEARVRVLFAPEAPPELTVFTTPAKAT